MSIFDIMSQQQSPSLGGTGGIGALGAGNAIYPQSRMDKTQYATPMQLPTSADVISSDYDPKTDAYTGMPSRFARGGIAAIPRFDGEETSQVEAPKEWDPSSGQVKLQQYEDPKDPFSGVKSLVDYSIPKDQIQTYIPNTDIETGKASGGGQLILKDGSSLGVDGSGVVHAATPGRNDYTLNKEGYYQPTGANLTWDPNLSRLTKKVGGIDVDVPGLYTKGGYQDPQGKLRTNEYGMPVPLAPAYLDSGAGKSGLADAAPYIAAAALGGGAYLASPAMTGFAGMVPASQTLLGAGAATAPVVSTTAGDVFAGYSPTGSAAGTAGTTVPAGYNTAVAATPAAVEAAKVAAVKEATTIPTAAKVGAGLVALNALGGSRGSAPTSYPVASTTTTEAPRQQQNIASQQFNPYMNYASMTMPGMSSSMPGAYYQPLTYRYMAQGGVADLGGYAVGGKLLKGDGDGMSDDIEANIGGAQPARLADGEFVIPADVVSHLGNGSTDAGAKQLYKMMDRIRQARTGNKKQGKRINPEKFFPKG